MAGDAQNREEDLHSRPSAVSVTAMPEECLSPGSSPRSPGRPRWRPLPLQVNANKELEDTDPAAVAYAAYALSGDQADSFVHSPRSFTDPERAGGVLVVGGSLPSSLSNGQQRWRQRAATAHFSSQVEEESEDNAQAGVEIPGVHRRLRNLSDVTTVPPGRSPPLSPRLSNAGAKGRPGRFDALHDALHIGPLDIASALGGVDPAVVYVRLQNFSARRRGLMRLLAKRQEDILPSVEPTTPFTRGYSHEQVFGDEPLRPEDESGRPGRQTSIQSPTAQRLSPKAAAASPCVVEEKQRDSVGQKDKEGLDVVKDDAISEREDTVPEGHADRQPTLERRLSWGAGRTDITFVAESDGEEDAEVAEIAAIQFHLEAMNSAATDLNASQERLNATSKQRRIIVQLWAVGSARLARAVGAHRLAKATPYFDCQRRCKAAQEKVEHVTSRFLTGCLEDKMAALIAEHAACLAEYQAAKSLLAKEVAKSSALAPSALAAVAPYFEAEDEHRQQLLDQDAQVAHFQRFANESKARYHNSLWSLEALSNQAHIRRAASGDVTAAAAEPRSGLETPRQVSSPSCAMSPPLTIPVQRRSSCTTEEFRPATTTSARSLRPWSTASRPGGYTRRGGCAQIGKRTYEKSRSWDEGRARPHAASHIGITADQAETSDSNPPPSRVVSVEELEDEEAATETLKVRPNSM